MTLLGMREYRLDGPDGAPVARDDFGLGILRDPAVNVLRRGRAELQMTPEILAFLKEPQTLIITKANVKSLVHRRVHMDYVGVKLYDDHGRVAGELRIVGLMTAAAYNDPVASVPYIRRKAEYVIEKTDFTRGGYSARALANVLESYPRDELFQIARKQLLGFARDIMALADRPRIRALARVDRFDRFVSILVYVPKDRTTARCAARSAPGWRRPTQAVSRPPIPPIRRGRSPGRISSSAATRGARRGRQDRAGGRHRRHRPDLGRPAPGCGGR